MTESRVALITGSGHPRQRRGARPHRHPWYEGAEQVWASSREWITENTPLRRVGTPEDVAEATHHLVDAAYTTGDVLTVDGGRHVV